MGKKAIIRSIFFIWFILILVSDSLVSYFQLEYDGDAMWWVFALICTPAWFGAETANSWGLSDGMTYFLGMASAVITLGVLYKVVTFVFIRKGSFSRL